MFERSRGGRSGRKAVKTSQLRKIKNSWYFEKKFMHWPIGLCMLVSPLIVDAMISNSSNDHCYHLCKYHRSCKSNNFSCFPVYFISEETICCDNCVALGETQWWHVIGRCNRRSPVQYYCNRQTDRRSPKGNIGQAQYAVTGGCQWPVHWCSLVTWDCSKKQSDFWRKYVVDQNNLDD